MYPLMPSLYPKASNIQHQKQPQRFVALECQDAVL
jgi:hypothetical protein